MILRWIMTIGLMSAAPVMAAERQVARFSVGERELSWSLPDGYCLPKGTLSTVAQMISSVDQQNLTLLTLFPCDADAEKIDRYILVKAPVSALAASIPRKQLLTMIGAEFDKPEFKQFLEGNSLSADLEKRMSSLFGTSAEATGTVVPMGINDNCGLVGGAMQFKLGTVATHVGLGGCVTAVDGKVLSTYAYDNYQGPETVKALLSRATELAQSIIAENEAPTP